MVVIAGMKTLGRKLPFKCLRRMQRVFGIPLMLLGLLYLYQSASSLRDPVHKAQRGHSENAMGKIQLNSTHYMLPGNGNEQILIPSNKDTDRTAAPHAASKATKKGHKKDPPKAAEKAAVKTPPAPPPNHVSTTRPPIPEKNLRKRGKIIPPTPLSQPFTRQSLDSILPSNHSLPDNQVSMVIIHSYRGAGSGVIDDALRAFNSTFFLTNPFSRLVQEHLSKLKLDPKSDFLVDSANGQMRSTGSEIKNKIMELGKNILECNVRKIRTDILADTFPLLRKCIRTEKKYKMKNKCITHLENMCKSSHIRGFKTVHASTDFTLRMLENHTDFRLVMHMRDPRAIYASRERYQPDARKSLAKIWEICHHMETDMRRYYKAKDAFNRNVAMETNYDEFVRDPRDTVDKMYRFLGWKLTGTELFDIVKEAAGDIKDTYKAGGGWQKELTKETVHEIEQRCPYVIHKQGYNKETRGF